MAPALSRGACCGAFSLTSARGAMTVIGRARIAAAIGAAAGIRARDLVVIRFAVMRASNSTRCDLAAA